MKFDNARMEFLKFCETERRLSEHTLHAYASDLADFRKWLRVNVDMARISQAELKGYLGDLIEKRQLSVATVRRRFACLRAFFRRFAEINDTADPFLLWRPKLPRRRRLPRALSRAEASSLLDSLRSRTVSSRRDAWLAMAIRLMVSTGIRVGELCKLGLDDVSPDGSALRIHGKGSRDRIAYVTDAGLQADLQRTVRRQRAKGEQLTVLVNRQGLTMKPQSIRIKLRRFALDVGLSRRVTPHMLRHTAATMLIETGVDIRFVQRLLGHSSIATTEIYTHVSDEALRVTLERAGVLAMLAGR